MKPLAGLKVLVTRPRAQADEFVAKLSALGAVPLLLPAIEIAPLTDESELRSALVTIGGYDWIVFTSVNGVGAVKALLEAVPESVKIAAIGPATAAAVASAYRQPDAMPDEFVSDAIGPVLGDVRGKRILLARADIARKDLFHHLVSQGALVDDVAAYRIVRAAPEALNEKPDVITATSSSSVLNTLANLRELGLEDWAKEAPWVCIGPVTAETAVQNGCVVAAVATEYTIEGLTTALLEFGQKRFAGAKS